MAQKKSVKSSGGQSDVEAGVEEVMATIDEHELSQAEVSRQTTVSFLKGIRGACQDRIDTILEEAEAEGEEVDDDEE